MKSYKYSFFVLAFLGGGLVFAQEKRSPVEKYAFEVESNSPADISTSVDVTGKIVVWSNYLQKVDNRGEFVSFSAKKYQIFERGKQVKTTQNLKDIPRHESVGVKRVSFSDGIEWSPSGGIEQDDKIAFKGMSKIGFQNDEFVLGPFDYTIRWATPLGLSKSGFLYVAAECVAVGKGDLATERDMKVFRIVYKLNKTGRLIDSYIYDTAKYIERTGMGARYPWDWTREHVQIDENGNLYSVTVTTGTQEGRSKIWVERWASK